MILLFHVVIRDDRSALREPGREQCCALGIMVCSLQLTFVLSCLVHLSASQKRSLDSLKLICELTCVSRCLQERGVLEDVVECRSKCMVDTRCQNRVPDPPTYAECPRLFALDRTSLSLTQTPDYPRAAWYVTDCLPRTCNAALNSAESVSMENPFKSRAGYLDAKSSLTTLKLNWTVTHGAFENLYGPTIFSLEELRGDTWTPYTQDALLSPDAVLEKLCDKRLFRFVAVNAHGFLGISPHAEFTGFHELPSFVMNLALRNLTSKDRVEGLLSWSLPLGVTGKDVDRYSVSAITEHCETPSYPAVHLSRNETKAKISNLRLGCRYRFNISFTTICGQISPAADLESNITCQVVPDGSCRELPKFGQGLVLAKEPEAIHIESVDTEWDGGEIFALVTWNPPRDLGSSDKIIGYEIWWGPAYRPVEALTWLYQFSENVTIVSVPENTTSFAVRGLSTNMTYGIKIAALGNVPYNVAYVLQYRELRPFFTFSDILSEEIQGDDAAGPSNGLVAVYVAVPVLVCILLGAGMIIWRIRKNEKVQLGMSRLNARNALNTLFPSRYKTWDELPKTNARSSDCMFGPPDHWEIPRTRIVLAKSLGKGAFGEVFRAKLQGTVLLTSDPKGSLKPRTEQQSDATVAVKLLPVHADMREKEAFLHEIQVMKDIGYQRHIVSLIACCTISDPVCLVEEFCPLGDLLQFLVSKRHAMTFSNPEYLGSQTEDFLTYRDLLSYARQIAMGMEYIHRKGYVHRDIAARNILLVDNGLLKIGDFGLTRYIYEDHIYVMQNAGKLPVKWMAIESIFDYTFTPASDVWAFGVVLFELVTLGGTPYPTISNKDLLSELKSGYRMDRPDNCSPEMYAVMMQCWSSKSELRPTSSDLLTITQNFLASSSDEEYLQLTQEKDYYMVSDPDRSTTTL